MQIAFSPQEVADMWGVHYNTVVKAIKERRLTATKFEGAWRITQVALDAYIQKRTIKAKG
ncbi:hypothetical protein DCC81_24620 [Chitinophaga parva]|uniref:Helix-turn-helix domain-containing protein n=1 Tax=Chitinophaga parva TaxID=2169414 RepID=A0A2T7BBK4_9BACT|nr:helix-turn-helix domain-containing protein [Chitinophaga parva]PUZ21775.1 hypothetical protein DCC81_24620 [Chitinophaga parva]